MFIHFNSFTCNYINNNENKKMNLIPDATVSYPHPTYC